METKFLTYDVLCPPYYLGNQSNNYTIESLMHLAVMLRFFKTESLTECDRKIAHLRLHTNINNLSINLSWGEIMLFMNNPTRHKLNEASYFLSTMKEVFNNTDIFHFNLNAFLTASRSITFYMQKQYKKYGGFSDWYRRKQLELSNDQELRFLLTTRNDIIHKEPVGTTTEFQCFSQGAFITDINNEEEVLEKLEQILKRETKIKATRRFFAQDDKIEIVGFCENQLNKLTKLVDECEICFPQQEVQ